MKRTQKRTGICQITKKEYPLSELVALAYIHEPILNLIREKSPDIDMTGYISIAALRNFRYDYVKRLMESEHGELGALEEQVIDSLRKAEILSKNVDEEIDRNLTLGQVIADRVATVGGSWGFILSFLFFIVVWMVVNTAVLLSRPFDPFPYILLNLVLSCVAAIQAPIIMMSQNRQEAKDRLRSEHDYQVNLKAELEIRQLHDKIDHLLVHQSQRLLDLQQIQIDLMEEILGNSKTGKK
jgi:uncharacterized membrane protein